MSLVEKRNCGTCKFCRRQDTGYSNWTVMDTDVDCLKDLNPGMPTEESVETERFAAIVDFGKTCAGFVEGVGPFFDVDGETTIEEYKDDADVYALLKAKETP